MNQTTKTILYIVGGLLLLALLIGVLTQLTPPTNWRKNYAPESSHPFGSKLVYERMGDLFEPSPQVITKDPFYQTVYEPRQDLAYFFHDDYISISQELTIEELKSFVKRGNDLFLSANRLSLPLEEWLGITLLDFELNAETDSTYIVLPGENFRYPIHPEDVQSFIENDGFYNTQVLASVVNGSSKEACFVRLSVGEGSVYVSSVPDVLSNYYLLNPRTRSLISYMLTQMPSDRQIWWDQYKGVGNPGGGGNDDPGLGWLALFNYLNEFPSFSWALWILIIGSLIYVLFEGKRTQRRVPEIAPLPNSTVDFTRTIGRLYFQVKNNHRIATKRVKILLAFIRSTYNIPTRHINSEFEQQLVAKSGVKTADIASLCFKISALTDKTFVSDDELMNLMYDIEIFYAATKYKQST
ncbi:MAG: DUF4350 domain-containing protein [Bacteroidota bacterium]